ncbi:MAG: DUF4234 domain-containing protein [Clostridiales bacterium]|nr:DUF4234 domain-containing protein [Clostridiales bacterium]
MAFCPNCGSQIADGLMFCPACGAQTNNANPNGNNQQPYGAQPQNPPFGDPNYNNPQQGYAPPYGAPQYGQPMIYPSERISFGQRNLAVTIILTIVTFGIYGIYWLIKMVDELNEASREQNPTSGGMVFLLSIVTCGIYLLIWLYKAGERVNRAKGMRGLPTDSNTGIIYLVLSIFGLSIVSYALIQIELNKIAAYHGCPAA